MAVPKWCTYSCLNAVPSRHFTFTTPPIISRTMGNRQLKLKHFCRLMNTVADDDDDDETGTQVPIKVGLWITNGCWPLIIHP